MIEIVIKDGQVSVVRELGVNSNTMEESTTKLTEGEDYTVFYEDLEEGGEEA